MGKKIILLIVLLGMMGGIFYMSSLESSESGGQSGRVLIFLGLVSEEDVENSTERYNFYSFWVRKLAHFSVYAVLGIVIYLNLVQYAQMEKVRIPYSILLLMFYAASDEVHQNFVPGRSMELRDVMIDTAGGMSGILFVAVSLKLLKNYLDIKKGI